MKILYFNYMADLYGYSIGSTIKAIKLFDALGQRGHSVRLFWLAKQSQLDLSESTEKPPQKPSFVRDLLFTPKQLVRNVVQLCREAKILRSEKADLLIVRLDAFRISALLAARLYQLPLIVEADGASSYEWLTFNNGRHLWAKALLWCERLMLTHAQGVFTQSNQAKEYFIRQHGLAPEHIAVITNGADPVKQTGANDNDTLRNELGLAPDSKIIGFLGSMHHWHGLSDAPRLVDSVLAEFDKAAFLFVGSGGALETELRKSLAKKYAGRVVFTGRVPNEKTSQYVNLFSIAIAPYPKIDLFYFSPMKIFEYMAAEKAIVAARIGQVCDVLQDGENGVLYEPGDLGDLKLRLFALLRDASLQTKIGQNARNTFLKGYTWSHKAKELESFIQQCIGQI